MMAMVAMVATFSAVTNAAHAVEATSQSAPEGAHLLAHPRGFRMIREGEHTLFGDASHPSRRELETVSAMSVTKAGPQRTINNV